MEFTKSQTIIKNAANSQVCGIFYTLKY